MPSLGETLAHLPEFEFDLPTYARGIHYSKGLQTSIRRSAAFFAGDCSVALQPAEIDAFVKAFPHARKLLSSGDTRPSEKDDLRKLVDRAVKEPNIRGFTKETSGTSGPPLRALYSEFFYFLNSAAGVSWCAAAAGIKLGERSISAVSVRNARPRRVLLAEPWPEGRVTAKISLDERKPETFKGFVDLLRQLDPEVIISKPTILQALLWVTRNYSPQELPRPKLIVSSGQTLDLNTASALEKRFSSTLLDVYATTELGLAALRCSVCRNFHFDESRCYLQSSSDGMLVSMILNDLMPLFDYKIDELVSVDSCCPTGAKQLKVTRIKPGQFIPLTDDVGLDLGRLRVGFNLNKAIESITATVNGRRIEIAIRINDPVLPHREQLERLAAFSAPIVPSGFRPMFEVISPGLHETNNRIVFAR